MSFRSVSFGLGLSGASVAALLAIALPVGRAREEPAPQRAFARPQTFAARQGGFEHDRVWMLGRRLFFDPLLSASSSMSCGSCHKPDQSWTDHLPRAVGEAKKPLAFRAPTLLNAGQVERYGWTGRFGTIEAVSFFAMTSPTNMNVSPAEIVARLSADPSYVTEFKAAFADGAITKRNIGTAFDRYVRSITSDEAPFDRWTAGDATAISGEAKHGFALFTGKAGCAACHSGWAFTDASFHDIGVATGDDIGRGKLFQSSVKLRYAFKTPTLRNVATRAPYMHDGSRPTLEAVIDLYDKGGIDRPSRAEEIKPLHLTDEEKRDLIAFLQTLSGGTTFVAPTN